MADLLMVFIFLAFFLFILWFSRIIGASEEPLEMSWTYIIAGLVAVGLFIYLGVALFQPEAFE